MTGLVDTHAHLMDRAFTADLDGVLARAASAGVTAFVLVGYDALTSQLAVQLARKLPNARATVGIHPNAAAAATSEDFQTVADLAADPLVVGIGETGLDYYRDRTPPAQQRQALDWHVQLATRHQLPLIVHNRQADADVAAALTSTSLPASVLHCFSSADASYAARMLEAGFYFSLAGPLTYSSSKALRALVKTLPADRLLVETDCPYLPPASRRGQRNEPAYMPETARCLEQLTTADTTQLWSNSTRVFPALADVVQEVA